MNSIPDPLQQHAAPSQNTGDSPSGTPVLAHPSAPGFVRIQKYLAPLETLGNQNTAWLGSALLFVGVFLPVKAVTIPFLNLTLAASFWDFAKFESFVLILLALASAGLAYVRDYRWLWATGIAASLFLFIEFFNSLTGSYLRPSWGWLVLFPGVALIFAAAALKPDPRETSGDAVTVIQDLVRRMSNAR